jgi:uncharacterized membrane protein YqjE
MMADGRGADGASPDPEVIGPRPKAERSIAALLADLANETILLIRQEIALLRAELGENLGRAFRGAVAVAIGALFALSGWLALLAAAIIGLAQVVPAWAAALIVGGVVLVLGGIAVYLGLRRFAADALLPRRSIASLRRDEAWIKEQMR